MFRQKPKERFETTCEKENKAHIHFLLQKNLFVYLNVFLNRKES